MRTRTVLAATLAVVAAAGSFAPALAAPPKVIKGSWTASATPDPTGDTPNAGAKCKPVTPTGRATQAFTVPGPGMLEVHLNNKLDWSGDIRAGDEVLGDADGSGPNDAEVVSASFKKKTSIVMGACNLEGEPSLSVTYVFTPKKR